jgi:hypothetical protein
VRDRQLAVGSHDVQIAHIAIGIATALHAAFDDWNFIAQFRL